MELAFGQPRVGTIFFKAPSQSPASTPMLSPFLQQMVAGAGAATTAVATTGHA
jgi:hypothetical protein